MPWLCACYGCKNDSFSGVLLYNFPADIKLSRKWDKFVINCNRKDWSIGTGNKHKQICALHFIDADFMNYFQWSRGYASVLVLQKVAVPSMFCKNVTPGRRQQLQRCAKVTPNVCAPTNQPCERGIYFMHNHVKE